MASTETGEATTTSGQPSLKRVMGPGLLLLFIIGDVLGTGIYALTGTVAAEVGGVVWLPFLIAFLVALITAFSYLELVTKYPQAAGAALYTHKAFGIHFVTFLVAFAVMSSGITSASTAARAFSENAAEVFEVDIDGWGITLIGLGFMALVAAVNLRGVGESVKSNVVLTCVELSGLLIIIGIGAWALFGGEGDFGRVSEFDTGDKGVLAGVIAATGLAFFAMVGFEDSVNMAEECKEPRRIFPKVLLTGLGITGLIYVLVSISAIALVPADQLSDPDTPPLLRVVEAGAPDFPLSLFGVITMFAVANTALINMLMASRLVYGLARERVLPPVLGRVLPGRRTPWTAIAFTTLLAFGLVLFVGEVPALGGTTALLLLVVFTVVNVAVLVLRKDPVDADHFRTPTILPVVGALACGFLATPFSGRPAEQYRIAGVLLVIGIALWGVTVAVNKRTGAGPARIDPEHLADEPVDAPRG
ncbi:APC family permease [Blastococcus sp. URHD0036]|uniref:APC family permease n=1 Tax=Blastococcus sp. URHD0036 TaxID=1380356 RepID=UPI000496EA39|nr:APC family permease [Blastococcus sp. URHD0036]